VTSKRTYARAVQRPIVFLLVYGGFLVLIGITASAQAVLVSAHFTTSVLNAVVATDRSVIGSFVGTALRTADLGGGLDAARSHELQQGLTSTLIYSDLEGSRVMAVEVRSLDGSVLFGTVPDRAGTVVPPGPAGRLAAAGQPQVQLDQVDSAAQFGIRAPPHALVEQLPIESSGKPVAIIAVLRDATPLVASLDATRRDIAVLTVVAALIVSVLLYFIFRAAQRRISRQTLALVETARRDTLTGLLNHGSAVEELELLAAGLAGSGRIGVALLDIDNFRLLNETYGHEAGDHALRRVGGLLASYAQAPYLSARYGPDEFLLLAPQDVAGLLGGLVDTIRADLADTALQFGSSERLPVTLSGAIAHLPDNADNVTELLSTAVLTLGEAKASGGDAVRMASRSADERADARGFDVLHGLVIAVDTKDRYTRRHSEDVARYASFIARRMGLDQEFQSTIRLAGLLHDVGKIGIPDTVLRKPGRLSPDERAIVEQHVALGDAIVRDLPNVQAIRAAVRHHHERWDGKGYLDRLTGMNIPLIARVLAVADAFSAMTTNRPYRKALGLREALDRLGDAAGTQLDEELVAIFITGMETARDAPLPGETVPAAQLWTPRLEPS
jgi:diguanylate cyclase (GGDEF)-like protein/putative nucleotidyltransferase with HDIG domain